jgi:hypothetical protein
VNLAVRDVLQCAAVALPRSLLPLLPRRARGRRKPPRRDPGGLFLCGAAADAPPEFGRLFPAGFLVEDEEATGGGAVGGRAPPVPPPPPHADAEVSGDSREPAPAPRSRKRGGTAAAAAAAAAAHMRSAPPLQTVDAVVAHWRWLRGAEPGAAAPDPDQRWWAQPKLRGECGRGTGLRAAADASVWAGLLVNVDCSLLEEVARVAEEARTLQRSAEEVCARTGLTRARPRTLTVTNFTRRP